MAGVSLSNHLSKLVTILQSWLSKRCVALQQSVYLTAPSLRSKSRHPLPRVNPQGAAGNANRWSDKENIMANVKVTQDKNGVRWLELMRNGSGTLLEIRNEEEAMQIMVALQQSVQADLPNGVRLLYAVVSIGIAVWLCVTFLASR